MKEDIGFYVMLIGFVSLLPVLPIVVAIAPEYAPVPLALGLILLFGGANITTGQR